MTLKIRLYDFKNHVNVTTALPKKHLSHCSFSCCLKPAFMFLSVHILRSSESLLCSKLNSANFIVQYGTISRLVFSFELKISILHSQALALRMNSRYNNFCDPEKKQIVLYLTFLSDQLCFSISMDSFVGRVQSFNM